MVCNLEFGEDHVLSCVNDLPSLSTVMAMVDQLLAAHDNRQHRYPARTQKQPVSG